MNSNFIVLKIEDRYGDIYQIDTHGKNKCTISEPGAYGVLGKNRSQLVYQSMIHMAKMEPDRYTVIVDNGDLMNYTHMPVHTLAGIINMFPHFIETGQKHWIDLCEKFYQETLKTHEYDQDHNIPTNYYTNWDPVIA